MGPILSERDIKFVISIFFEYVNFEDKQVGSYNSKKAQFMYSALLTLVFIHVLLILFWKSHFFALVSSIFIKSTYQE